MEFVKSVTKTIFQIGIVFAFIFMWIGYSISEKGVEISCSKGHLYVNHVLYQCIVDPDQSGYNRKVSDLAKTSSNTFNEIKPNTVDQNTY